MTERVFKARHLAVLLDGVPEGTPIDDVYADAPQPHPHTEEESIENVSPINGHSKNDYLRALLG